MVVGALSDTFDVKSRKTFGIWFYTWRREGRRRRGRLAEFTILHNLGGDSVVESLRVNTVIESVSQLKSTFVNFALIDRKGHDREQLDPQYNCVPLSHHGRNVIMSSRSVYLVCPDRPERYIFTAFRLALCHSSSRCAFSFGI